MKYISVFSGIEAATVAWRPLGWEAIAFSEIEPFPCQVLKHYYPDVPNLGDISKVDWRQFLGTVDLVVGGSPCQSFSVAGSRTGLDGASGLVREYFRLLSECKPRWFLWENVPGVVSSNGGLDWIFILREWHKLGYNVSFRVLDAQYAGVPQRRRRIFAVGYLGDWRPPAKVLFESYSLQRHPAPCREKRKNHTEGSEVCSYKAGGFGEWNEGIGTCRASRQGDETLVAKTLSAKNGYRLNAEDENLLVAKCLTSKNQLNDMETETLVYSIAGNTIDRQIQNGGNGSGFQQDISYTLNTVDRHAVAECYSFDSLASNSMKSSNPDSGCRKVDVAKTLDTSNGDPSKNQGGIAVCYPIDLRSLGKTKKEDMPVGEEGPPAYTLTKSFTHGVAFCSDVSPTISASGPPFSRPGNDYVETEALVCQEHLVLKDREGKPGGGKGLLIGKDQSSTLSCNQDQSMFHHAAVRRLTPTECERLQGFSDGYTDVPFRGKPAPDSARYKALGNSMCVNVMAWIGKRIQMVEDDKL